MMKKVTELLLVLGGMVLLAACGSDPETGNDGNGQGNGGVYDEAMTEGSAQAGGHDGASAPVGEEEGNGVKEDEEVVTRQLRIVDGAESGNLVLAGEDGNSLYTLSVQENRIPVYLDGRTADSSALEDGMMVEVRFDGNVLETYPCQFARVYGIDAYSLGTAENPGGGYYDLCGLYLQVLNDLWEKDAGLNEGVRYVGVDLSEAPGGLTQGEKDAVAWIFACEHNGEALLMSYEELEEQGYLTKVENTGNSELYQWEDGILFSITAEGREEEDSSLPTVRFEAKKWRSPQGAYYFMDCHAVWPLTGTWDGYEIGGEAIS